MASCGSGRVAYLLTFNCGIVLVDKVALDELDSQARLADSTSAYHHQLVLAKELCLDRRRVSIGAWTRAAAARKGRQRQRGGSDEGRQGRGAAANEGTREGTREQGTAANVRATFAAGCTRCSVK